MKNLLFISIIALSLSSCVTKKVYNEQVGQAEKYKAESELCADNLEETQASLDDCNSALKDCNETVDGLVSDTLNMGQEYRNLSRQYADLEMLYDTLNAQNQAILKMSSIEKEALKSELLKKEQELLRREERVAELEAALAQKDSALIRLKNNISEALIGFSDDQLSVELKDGKLYVSLSEKLLFKTGSTKVDPKGEDALNKVAQVLKAQDNIDIVVEGHTDDVPYVSSSGPIKDNWDLSVLRATSVVRILTGEGNLAPTRVVASGRGEFVPVASNDSEKGRASNRRTEIIISPNLEQIFDILDK
jgi:chemotaxis protein MotB